MNKAFIRKPLSNFFIKKDLQVRLILKIVMSVIAATAVFAATILLTYHVRYGGLAYYQLDLEHEGLTRYNMVSIILPSLIISAFVNIAIAFCVGLYASRKYAVPVYKLEQWAKLLRKGHMSAKLRFREREEMRELSNHCNLLSDDLRTRFSEIKRYTQNLKEKNPSSDDVSGIEEVLSGLELEADSIEVHTSYGMLLPEQEISPKNRSK